MGAGSVNEEKKVTIRDIARQAGVGIGTVSRVLNEHPSVSNATRQRVQQAIIDLEYLPNPTARRLSTGKTLTISVLVPFFTRPSFIERLRGIENSLVDTRYDLNIYNVETVQRRDELLREIPRRERSDGVIILSLSPRDQDIPLLTRADAPIVLVDANHPSLTDLNRVIVDDIEGGYLATRHLIELGHRRIGYISDYMEDIFNFTSSRDRHMGYQRALLEAGIPVDPALHRQGEHGRIEAYQMALTLLKAYEPPTAVFAASDTQAMGVLQAARELGLDVPENLSIIGYDDIEVAEYLGLTTIHQELYHSGQRGVELLLKILDGSLDGPVCEILPIKLIVRNTTAPVR